MCISESPNNANHCCVSLQNKAADTFSMFGSDIYKHAATSSFKLAASESKIDGKTDYNPLQPCNKKKKTLAVTLITTHNLTQVRRSISNPAVNACTFNLKVPFGEIKSVCRTEVSAVFCRRIKN